MSSDAYRNIDEAIGSRVRSLRTAAKLTTEKVAESANMALPDYEASERGDRRFNALELYHVAQALQIDFRDLVSGIQYSAGSNSHPQGRQS